MKQLTLFFSLFSMLVFAQQTVMANQLLYVFYPTDIRPKKMEKHITRHCPEISTTVFGKIKDFEQQSFLNPPDAILSYAPVIKKNQQYSSLIQGFKQGQSYEDYFLVSIGKPVNLNQLASIKVGVLDILGRKLMKSFISERLGTKVKIARVTKTEDILNLLAFGLADAIFISRQNYDKLRVQSQLSLVAIKLDIQMDLAVLAIKNDESKQLFLNCFKRLDRQTNALLGVDQWAQINEHTGEILRKWLWALK